MPKPYKIYRILCLANQKSYIGITRRSLAERWRSHCSEKRRRRIVLAIQKYGAECFRIELLSVVTNEDTARALERELIIQYNAMVPHGYNLTSGGEGAPGFTHTSEARAKMSAQRRGRTLTPKWRVRIADAQRGRKATEETRAKLRNRNFTWGDKISAAVRGTPKSPSQEQREALALAARIRFRGKKRDPDSVAKTAAAHRGRKRSPETCARIGSSKRGTRHTAKTRAKMSASQHARQIRERNIRGTP